MDVALLVVVFRAKLVATLYYYSRVLYLPIVAVIILFFIITVYGCTSSSVLKVLFVANNFTSRKCHRPRINGCRPFSLPVQHQKYGTTPVSPC
jgi:hypothetical protein